jgi:hypothetical protein
VVGAAGLRFGSSANRVSTGRARLSALRHALTPVNKILIVLMKLALSEIAQDLINFILAILWIASVSNWDIQEYNNRYRKLMTTVTPIYC